MFLAQQQMAWRIMHENIQIIAFVLISLLYLKGYFERNFCIRMVPKFMLSIDFPF